MTTIYAESGSKIRIGKQGEKGVTEILFPAIDGTTVVLLHRRHGDEHPYEPTGVTTKTVDGVAYVCWTIAAADTAVAGIGECEVSYYKGETIAKTITYYTVIDASVEDGEIVVPTASRTWVQTVADKSAAAAESAAAAAASAESIVESAETIETLKTDKVNKALVDTKTVSPDSTNAGYLFSVSEMALVKSTAKVQYSCDTYTVSDCDTYYTFDATGAYPSKVYPCVVIVDDNDNLLYQSVYDSATNVFTDSFAMPDGAKTMYINRTQAQSAGVTMHRYSIEISDYLLTDDIKDTIAGKLDAPLQYTEIDAAETLDNVMFNALTGATETPASQVVYYCNKYDVSEIDNIKVIGIQPAAKYALCSFVDSTGAVISYTKSDDITILDASKAKATYSAAVPDNAVTAYVNGRAAAPASAYEGKPVTNISDWGKNQLLISRTDTGISVTDGLYGFEWKKNGANSLINFASASYNGESLFSVLTDWIGPYDFLANQNANGDKVDPDSAYTITTTNTTGGNHNIAGVRKDDQTAVSNTTGRTASFAVYADSAEISDSAEHWCTTAEIRWVNYIQAGNTAKIDSAGRECIKEFCHAKFLGGGVIEVGVSFQALEEITMQWYAGMQYAGHQFAEDFYIPEYSKTLLKANEINSTRNEEKVSYITAYGDKANLEMYFDRDYATGKREISYYAEGGDAKCYFGLYSRSDSSVIIPKGEINAWQGYYRFEPGGTLVSTASTSSDSDDDE